MDAIKCNQCDKIGIQSEEEGVCILCKMADKPLRNPNVNASGNFVCQAHGCDLPLNTGELVINLDSSVIEEFGPEQVQEATRMIVKVMFAERGMLCPGCMTKYVGNALDEVGFSLIVAMHQENKRQEFEAEWQ